MVLYNRIKSIHLFPFLFLALLGVHICCIFTGLNHSISDVHGFRQTQTAISAYYLVEDGFSLTYQTPVLGYPWSIPFEFPLYQWLVAQADHLLHIDFNAEGRIVSIFAFYAMLAVLFFLLRSLSYTPAERLFVLSVFLFNPTLLFWGRTFMIESTTTLMAVLYLMTLIKISNEVKGTGKFLYHWIGIATVFGSIAALTKITTFVLYMICGFLFLAVAFYNQKNEKKKNTVMKELTLISLLAFVVPLCMAAAWTVYTEKIRNLNFFATRFDAANMRQWTIGSFDQRLSMDTWLGIEHNCFHYLSISICLCILAFLFSLKNRFQILILTFSGFMGPILFANLYFVHDYYSSANTVFFSLSVGLFGVSLWEKRKRYLILIPGTLAVCFVLWLSVTLYFNIYYVRQTQNFDTESTVGKEIKRLTSSNDVLLLQGQDWSSEIPYYSCRRTLGIPNWADQDFSKNPEFYLDKFKTTGVTGYAVFTNSTQLNETGRRIIAYYGLTRGPYELSNKGMHCFLFLK